MDDSTDARPRPIVLPLPRAQGVGPGGVLLLGPAARVEAGSPANDAPPRLTRPRPEIVGAPQVGEAPGTPDRDTPDETPDAPTVRPGRSPDSAGAFHGVSGPGLRHWLWRVGRVLGATVHVTLIVPLIVALALAALLFDRDVPAPDWLVARIEAEARAAAGIEGIDADGLTLRIGRDLRPVVRLTDLRLTAADGAQVLRIPEVALTLASAPLIAREVRPVALEVRGARVGLSRRADGRIAGDLGARGMSSISSDGPLRPPSRPARTLAALPQRIESWLDGPAFSALNEVRVDGMVLQFDDARAGRSWTLDDGHLLYRRDGPERRLTVSLALLGAADGTGAGEVSLTWQRPSPGAPAEVTAVATNIAARDLAAQAPAAAWLATVDAPLSASLRATLGPDGSPGETTFAFKMGAGAIEPGGAAAPVPVDDARAYLAWLPEANRLDLRRMTVAAPWGGLTARGTAFLEGDPDGLPDSLVAEVTLGDLTITTPDLFGLPIDLPEASATARLRFRPLALDLTALGADLGDGARLSASGSLAAEDEGWRFALDATAGMVSRDRLLDLWPEATAPGVRHWVDTHVQAGTVRHATFALRRPPGAAPVTRLAATFAEAEVRTLQALPPVTDGAGRLTLEGPAFTVALESGAATMPGGRVDLAGTSYAIRPDGTDAPPVEIGIAATGPLPALLQAADAAPMRALSRAGRSPDIASGGPAQVSGRVAFRLGPTGGPADLRFAFEGEASDVVVPALIPGRTLTAATARLAVDQDGIAVRGPVRLSRDGAPDLPVEAEWAMSFRDGENDRSRVTGSAPLDADALAALGIALPRGMVGGCGTAAVTIDLGAGEPPRARVESDLRGVELALPALGWRKDGGEEGSLMVEAVLGERVSVPTIRLDAPGLSLDGGVDLTAQGAFDRLRIDRMRRGDWLEISGALVARGDRAPAIEIGSGTLDLRRARFGDGGGGGGGEAGPISARLDRLRITDGIALDGVRLALDPSAGWEGTISGAINGGPVVDGRLLGVGDSIGARLALADAGAALAAAGLFPGARGGAMDLLVLPEGEGRIRAEASVRGLAVVDAPRALASLDAAAPLGLARQAAGQGVVFDTAQARLLIAPGVVQVIDASADGAGVGLTAQGSYDTESSTFALSGTVSPLNFLGGTRPGQGLFWLPFTLTGTPDAPQVRVGN